jgi:hypothetical protein
MVLNTPDQVGLGLSVDGAIRTPTLSGLIVCGRLSRDVAIGRGVSLVGIRIGLNVVHNRVSDVSRG